MINNSGKANSRTVNHVKAIALLSGGLDSTLAVRIILDQGIEVEALKFTSLFCQCDHGGRCFSAEVAHELGIPLKTMYKGEDYLNMLKNPKHGYGKGINPCIDCRIFMLKKAKEYAEASGACFLFTGEVLGQRPMSQHRRALETIDRETGLTGKILRPLSAQHLPETEAEKNGWVDRSRLLAIIGRSRKPQFKLAESFNITNFSCPAGGCLLTDPLFAKKLRDLFKYNLDHTMNDVALLKIGRHFRLSPETKLVVGRNHGENERLESIWQPPQTLLIPQGFTGPTGLIVGYASEEHIGQAGSIMASFSKNIKWPVSVESNDGNKKVHSIAEYVVDIEKIKI